MPYAMTSISIKDKTWSLLLWMPCLCVYAHAHMCVGKEPCSFAADILNHRATEIKLVLLNQFFKIYIAQLNPSPGNY